jgi:hypothetical protein
MDFIIPMDQYEINMSRTRDMTNLNDGLKISYFIIYQP